MENKFKNFDVSRSKIINDILIIKPSVSKDIRGTIFTTYHQEIYNTFFKGNVNFLHDKFSESGQYVLRGLHGDDKTWKLVTCVFGEIFQVVVDCRPESKTYLRWDSFTINQNNKKLVLLPPRFANGYCVLSKNAIYHYKLAYSGEYNDVDKQFVLKWDDPRVNISWPIETPVLNKRDQ